MARLKGAWLCLLATALSFGAAYAQIGGKPIEISGGAGISSPDARSHMKDGPAYNAALGWRWMPNLTLEAQGLWCPSDADTGLGGAFNFSAMGLDARWNLRPGEARAVPFVLAGMAYGQSHREGAEPAKLQRGAPTLGMGVLINLLNERTYLRLQARDVLFRDRDATSFNNYLSATAGLQMNLGGKEKDQDLDGVRDWLDKCPDTPIGAKVDAHGCPIDSDGDGVFDGLDQCPDTPKGAKVDAKGCPSDQDGDGVPDGIDQCADTPKGATVDAKGCPSDTDGDGVLDGLDQCPNTMKGCIADSAGCPKDSDGDGVCDGLDKCPATPAGLKVDANGCPIEVMEKETEMLDTGMIRIQQVNFETGKAVLLPESFPVLDVVGALLRNWPGLKVEIGGHTDSKGSAASNQKLSEARAAAVRDHLITKFPELKAEQLTVKGYGESKPIVPNTTPENLAKNRRVEFVVLNRDMLKKEIERRQMLIKEQTSPSPVPAAPDSTQH